MALRFTLGALLMLVAEAAPPNIVILLFDDFGWGDVGFNDPSVQETPNMKALANSSKVFSDFHSGASVCTVARAALLTGRYGLRTGIYHNFSPQSIGGLPTGELTLPQLLKDTHDSHMIGKWHLGHHDAFSPTTRGFQSWLGLPFSGDMGCLDHTPLSCKGYEDRSTRSPACPPKCPADDEPAISAGVPLYHSTSANCSGAAFAEGCNRDIVEQPVDEFTLNRRYTERIVDFLGSRSSTRPFLLYVGFAHTHSPLSYETTFANASVRPGWKSVFGNVLAELDHSVGRIVAALDDAGLREDTLLIVSSDNGPADSSSQDCDFLGSAGPFVGEWQRQNGGTHTATMKFNTWEGGHRVPGLFSWPGHITPGRTDALGSLLDLAPTLAALSGVALPTDRIFDGKDLSPLLFSDVADWSTPRVLFHPANHAGELTAGRLGKYKFFTKTQGSSPCFHHSDGRTLSEKNEDRDYQFGQELGSVRLWGKKPLVFDLSVDPSEANPVDAPADIVAQYLQALEETQTSIDNTLSHAVDWSENGTSAWPCCNADSSSCRCAAGAHVI